LNDLPGLDQLMKKSPINVSLYYNYSTNFQPAAQRNDMYGHSLAPPSGKTTEKGILLETKDGKYSFKVTKYETSSVNVTNSSLANTWFIGASQTWGGNWANHFQYDWTGDTYQNAVVNPDPNNSQYNYGLAPGETLAQAQAREQAAIAGWRAWQDQLKATPFYTAWQLDLTTPFRQGNPSGLNTTQPNGLSFTEDSVSKGYEFELQGQITQNWRITANASRTTAERNNVGGAALTDFVTRYETALNTTAAGDLRIWWGGAGNETTKYQWDNNVGSSYHMLKLLEGSNVPELRKWRFNLVNNYEFRSSFLKGLNVGGGLRYESTIIIGYPITSANATQVFYDLSNPYHGKGETNFDFWVGYTRKVWRNLEWNIQLNVRNAFVGDELVPINTQPVGTVAASRMRPLRGTGKLKSRQCSVLLKN
jgi:outer membrane receptor for ferric coprogen and ferric-rhodotorulic acid